MPTGSPGEARTLAALNHANIAHIYGLERVSPTAGSGQSGHVALVMELVEGETLAERTARGALDVDEALAIARQISLFHPHSLGTIVGLRCRFLPMTRIGLGPPRRAFLNALMTKESYRNRTNLNFCLCLQNFHFVAKAFFLI